MRRTLAMILTLVAALPASTQELTDVSKTPPSSCIRGGSERFGEVPPEPQPDDNTDFTNPLLGFALRALTPEDEAKAAEETCAPEEPATLEEPYEKAVDPTPGPCQYPSTIVLSGGVRDHYALPQDPANLTQQILSASGVPDPRAWTGFDTNLVNRHFGHAFWPQSYPVNGYLAGTLTLYLRPLADDLQFNDTLSVWSHGASAGWGARLQDLGVTTPGQEVVLNLDLKQLRTGGSNLLTDLAQFRNLNIVMQDDTAIDHATLTLTCNPSPTQEPLVGVLRGHGGCGRYPAYDVFLDNEDRRNANDRGGWIGETVSNGNTLIRLCGVPGADFLNAAAKGANFAVVSLSPTCPSGFARFDRFHDNEDNRPAAWDNTPSGSPTGTRGRNKDTNMAFCVATGSPTPTATNSDFPNLPVSYGVFGGRNAWDAAWSPARGWIFLDDEDRNNRNQPANPPRYTGVFLEAGYNTRYFVAKIR